MVWGKGERIVFGVNDWGIFFLICVLFLKSTIFDTACIQGSISFYSLNRKLISNNKRDKSKSIRGRPRNMMKRVTNISKDEGEYLCEKRIGKK